MIKKIMLLICVFMLGVLATNIHAYHMKAKPGFELPEDNSKGGYEYKTQNALERAIAVLQAPGSEVASPHDRIKEDQIMVTNEKIVINLKNAEWASFTDTNSMDPVIDSEAHAIEVIPRSEDDVHVGDIIAYKSEYAEGSIIHRVVHKGKDEKGAYFIVKGDNNPVSDPGKVRFSQIQRVVVAIIY